MPGRELGASPRDGGEAPLSSTTPERRGLHQRWRVPFPSPSPTWTSQASSSPAPGVGTVLAYLPTAGHIPRGATPRASGAHRTTATRGGVRGGHASDRRRGG